MTPTPLALSHLSPVEAKEQADAGGRQPAGVSRKPRSPSPDVPHCWILRVSRASEA